MENSADKPKQEQKPVAEGSEQAVKKEALELLKPDSMCIEGMYLPGRNETVDATPVGPFKYNENAGNIVFTDAGGRRWETPATNSVRETLVKHGFEKDSSIGVYWLNEKQLWGPNPEQNSSFKRWSALSEHARATQEVETQKANLEARAEGGTQ